MLTKEERAEIAERFISYDGNKLYFAELFKCLFGREIPRDATTKGSAKTVIDRLIDLCDTSNMIELPVDKDGEVIRIGDVVYDNNGEEYKVTGYKTLFEDTNITLSNGSEVAYTEKYPHNLTHKEPVTVKLLAQRIKRVLGDEASSIGVVPHIELRRIAKQLESLGDSDD
jgi:hypothetical protein